MSDDNLRFNFENEPVVSSSTQEPERTDSYVANDMSNYSRTQQTQNNKYVYEAPQIKEKKKHKKSFDYMAKLVGSAVTFGVIAALTFGGVNLIIDKLTEHEVVSEAKENDVEKETVGISVKKNEGNTNSNLAIMDVSEIVEKAMPSSVSISGVVTTQMQLSPFFGGNFEQKSNVSGSGIIIGQNDNELLIVTNAHVVDSASELSVSFIDGAMASAVVKGSKPAKDIAVIAVKLSDISSSTLDAISIIEIADSSTVKMGQPVIAIGNALGEGQSSTVGWISALNRTIIIEGTEYENLIMTDAAINPGNSGGALINSDGQLIGINSAKTTQTDVEGMGYAIPISEVADIINDLMNREIREIVDEDEIGYLGIAGMNITNAISKNYGWPIGALITTIGNDSPAEKAGLLKNDIITEFDGDTITTFEELREKLNYYREGETVNVKYYRIENGEYTLKDTDIVLGSRKKAQ